MSDKSARNSSSVLYPKPSPNESSSVTVHQRHPPIRRPSSSKFPNRLAFATANHHSKYSGAHEPKTQICARKRQTTRYLPAEIVFNILSLLPAHVLLDVMRHVCKEWNLMIRSQDFIRQHLRNSTSGILIQRLFTDGKGIYIRKIDCGEVGDVSWTSCNGLVLAHSWKQDRILHVLDPLTKQRLTLPPFIHRIGCNQHFCLAYVEASMEYKVVYARDTEFALRPQIAVLTVGVDKDWRFIDIDREHLSLITAEGFTYLPMVTGAYVHCIGKSFVLTLNVETETIRLFPFRPSWSLYGTVLPMGSNLSVICGPCPFKCVWEMNPETGKWIELLRFDVRPVSNKFKELFLEYSKSAVPCGWLKVREVLLFCWSGCQEHSKSALPCGWLKVREVWLFGCSSFQEYAIAYNLKTKEMHPFKLYTTKNNYQVHVNSLVCLEGAF